MVTIIILNKGVWSSSNFPGRLLTCFASPFTIPSGIRRTARSLWKTLKEVSSYSGQFLVTLSSTSSNERASSF